MSDTLLMFIAAAYVAQAIGFAIVGDSRRCGGGQAFAIALFCGPFAALALVLSSPARTGN